jgi:sulfur-oxidizing protein SoxY
MFDRIDEHHTRRREVLALLAFSGVTWLAPGAVGAQARRGGDPAHRIQVDVPILADDPVAVPLTVSMDHPMEPDHYVKSFEIVLATDPVPRKGQFQFTPQSGRASIAYQMRSGQGGEIVVTAECSRHGRFEAKESLRVAPGGCAVPAGAVTRERGGTPALRADAHPRPGQVVPVWASLKHTSHTGLVEKQGRFVQERPPYFVERVTLLVGDAQVSDFRLTPAVSPDPKLRFFVKADPGKTLRVIFVDNRGERWEATQRMA